MAKKPLKFLVHVSLLLIAISLPPVAFAQRNTPPSGINEHSTIQEILEYLNRTSFPYARIGLRVAVAKSVDSWNPNVDNRYPDEFLVFSAGFRLASALDDCHLVLRNENITVYDAEDRDIKPIDLKGLTESSPPYVAEFGTWLETVSHNGGKAPFLQSKNPARADVLGPWELKFQSRGFFVRSIFGVKIPALKQGFFGKDFETSDTVRFGFDDRAAAERFNSGFRRLIKLCQPRSTKPRWK
ncbi:MAG: hypothetical protein C5B55_04485 [Blastocatellia bacterium]|nr:MAG: hypothetical protein C5B55_04485 [Blastocatellia bacterium]